MRIALCNLRNAFGCAAMFTAIGLAGCGNFCVSGFFNNGNNSNNGAIIVPLNPSSVCSLTKANGTVRAVALKSAVCETCTAAARVEHVFVTVRDIQLRVSPTPDTNSPEWIEIAPQLASEPRQIDLIGNSVPEILVENAVVPAGSYSEVRVQFVPGSPADDEMIRSDNACGDTGQNCVLVADGHIEPLGLSGDAPEILLAPESNGSDSLVVLPDSRMDLRLSLEPRRVFYSFGSEGWKLQYVLVGRAAVVRQSSKRIPSG